MTARIERLFIALTFALLAAGVTLIFASAQSRTRPPVQTSSDCATCHTEVQMTWQTGAHGKAGSDPIFLDEWSTQGKPGACLTCHTTGYDPSTGTYKADGVTCESCHSPVPTDHPKNPLPVEPSAKLCGQCHSSTRFEVPDSQASTHFERGIDCASCHDPHSTSLQSVAGPRDAEKTDPVSQLCVTCHKESNMDFSLTAHAQKNVSCADCHVKEAEGVERAPHTVPDHSFQANLASCNTCHAQQMHSPTEAVNTKESAALPLAAQPTQSVQLSSITPEPGAVSPFGFSAMAGLIGLIGGMVLAPWLERWYRRTVKQNREEENE
jgi:predicted CXXCH cytochrome family protein